MKEGPVFWHQGLYLQPQHFQCTDQRTEHLLGDLAACVRPWFWGVNRLAVDEGALAAGTFALTEFEGLFPGAGVRLSVPGNAVCAGRVIPRDIVPVGDPLDIFLALDLLRPEGGNVTLADDQAGLAEVPSRFGVLGGQPPRPDLYEQGPDARVRRLTYVLRPVFGPEKEGVKNAALMRVARLKRGSDAFTVDDDYAPPCLHIDEARALSAVFREVRDRAIGKTRQMDSYKGLVSRGNMGDMTAIFLMLRSLSRFAARLEIHAAARRIPPWEAYLLLREMVAELSVFSREFNPLGEDLNGVSHIAAYAHDDPAPAFRSLRDLIARLLDGLSTGPRYMIPMEYADPFRRAELAPHVLENPRGKDEYWVLLQGGGTDLAAQAEAQKTRIRLGAKEGMAALLAHAVPGIPFNVESSAPLGLARQDGAAYLRLHHDSPLWQDVKTQQGLCLDWPEAPADMEAFFVVLGD